MTFCGGFQATPSRRYSCPRQARLAAALPATVEGSLVFSRFGEPRRFQGDQDQRLTMASSTHRASTGERINTADTTGRLQQALSARGLRMTRQRRAILQVMDEAQEHLDVDQILERAQRVDPDVHLVTVYRTIDLLKKQGLIDELDLLHLRGDRHYYESHGPRDHIHVACLRCGKVREFESKLYEQLKNQIARDFGMKVTVSRTEVGGYCADCLAKMPQ